MKGPSIDASVVILLALGILLVPIRWIGAWLLAVLVHEACHYMAVRICGGSVSRICVGAAGARMDIWGLGYWQEVFCALAGPLGGLLLLFTARWFPRTAVCALAQTLFNLLPVYPLDGGRAIRSVVFALFPGQAGYRICVMLQRGCLIGLVLLGAYAFVFLQVGIIPVVVAVLLVFRWFPVKRPCNSVAFSIQ